MALQRNGAGVPHAGRHHHAAAAGLRAGVDGLVDGLLVLGGVVLLQRRTILRDNELAVGELRLADAVLNLPVLAVPYAAESSKGHQQTKKQSL